MRSAFADWARMRITLKLSSMAQKIVSYNVAKALKDAGYPQELTDEVYSELGELVSSAYGEWHLCYDAPTYLDAWLWIATKGIKEAKMPSGVICRTMSEVYVCFKDSGETAEDDFVKSVEYVVDNNLIK